LSYLEKGRVWVDYLDRVSKTITSFAIINQTCEDTIKLMTLIDSGILRNVEVKWGKRKLPNYRVFVSVYYRRNITYLQSSHVSTCIGFIGPSANLNRTVFESLLKGYLFIVDSEEADEYFNVIETNKEKSYNYRKGVSYLIRKLNESKTSDSLKEFYRILCISAHADIKGMAADYPKYLPNRIHDNLSTILFLMYGNIQMMAECFFDFLDNKTKEIIKTAMENIAFDVGSVPLFEPNKEPYAAKLKLKKGNFLDAL
jgi:hypothetical protein